MFKWTVPATCTHESGNSSVALLSHSDAKRHPTDPITPLRPIKRQTLEFNSWNRDLADTLSGYLWGGLVDMDSYEPLELSMFLANFKQKEELARTFAGALIHFGSSLIMLLKVEVYDREPSGNFHAFNLAIPKVDLRTIGTTTPGNWSSERRPTVIPSKGGREETLTSDQQGDKQQPTTFFESILTTLIWKSTSSATWM
ncbi:MAG: hypothetical protein J3Q66DRAFT_149735 [Benniella sp.]|nr:MAG: hypothetical protein J3Q66DRAFT_149735 [Benniella sp.]